MHGQQIEEYRRELSMQVIMYLTLCGAGMCLLAAYSVWNIETDSTVLQREQMNIFRDLGMRASWRTALNLSGSGSSVAAFCVGGYDVLLHPGYD